MESTILQLALTVTRRAMKDPRQKERLRRLFLELRDALNLALALALLSLCLGIPAPATAGQQKPPADLRGPEASGSSPREGGAAPVIVPVSISMPEFLAKYEKLLTLIEARDAAEKKKTEYEAAAKVLDEQLAPLVAELRKQIPEGAVWDASKRSLVKAPEPPKSAPPAAPVEKPEAKPKAPDVPAGKPEERKP